MQCVSYLYIIIINTVSSDQLRKNKYLRSVCVRAYNCTIMIYRVFKNDSSDSGCILRPSFARLYSEPQWFYRRFEKIFGFSRFRDQYVFVKMSTEYIIKKHRYDPNPNPRLWWKFLARLDLWQDERVVSYVDARKITQTATYGATKCAFLVVRSTFPVKTQNSKHPVVHCFILKILIIIVKNI